MSDMDITGNSVAGARNAKSSQRNKVSNSHKQDIVKNIACPSCRENGKDSTGNHLMVFRDGTGYCNRCPKKYSKDDIENSNTTKYTRKVRGKYKRNYKEPYTLEDIQNFGSLGNPKRNIRRDTDKHFGVRTETDRGNGNHLIRYYPYYDEKDLFGYKPRKLPKSWEEAVGTIKETDLFGWHLCTGSRKTLIITEGEEDALAGWQMNKDMNKRSNSTRIRRSNPHVVSMPNGAKGLHKALMKHIEDILKYDKIIWMGDNYKTDVEGAKALEVAVQVFGVNKLYVAEYPEFRKDLCDILKQDEDSAVDIFSDMYFEAKRYQPADVLEGSEYTWDEIFKDPVVGYDTPFAAINDTMKGLRLREHTVLMAAAGAGKSTVSRAIGYHMGRTHGWKVGSIFLEEQDKKTVQGYVGCHLGIALNLLRENPDRVCKEGRDKAMEMISKDHMFLKHTGSIEPDVLMNKIRYMHNKGCKLVILDHLTMAVNGASDQRIALDLLLEDIYNFVENNDIHILSVIHLNRDSKSLFSRGAEITENNLRGSAGVLQQVMNAIAIEGDIQHETYNKYRWMRILKCREVGELGLCSGGYEYNSKSGKYIYMKDIDKDVLFEESSRKNNTPDMGGKKYDNSTS